MCISECIQCKTSVHTQTERLCTKIILSCSVHACMKVNGNDPDCELSNMFINLLGLQKILFEHFRLELNPHLFYIYSY